MSVSTSRIMICFGVALALMGIAAAKSAFDFDTTVYSSSTAFSSGSFVHNTGLQQEQMMRLILSVALMLMGTIIGSAGMVAELAGRPDTDVQPAPLTNLSADELAELEEDEAHRRRVASWMLAGGVVLAAMLYILTRQDLL